MEAPWSVNYKIWDSLNGFRGYGDFTPRCISPILSAPTIAAKLYAGCEYVLEVQNGTYDVRCYRDEFGESRRSSAIAIRPRDERFSLNIVK